MVLVLFVEKFLNILNEYEKFKNQLGFNTKQFLSQHMRARSQVRKTTLGRKQQAEIKNLQTTIYILRLICPVSSS